MGAELDEANGVPVDTKDAKRTKFRHLLSSVNELHDNFYENDKDDDHIEDREKDAAELFYLLEPLVDAPPQPFTPETGYDQRRLAALLELSLTKHDSRDQEGKNRVAQLDELIPKRKTDPNGFSPEYGYKRPWLPDDDGGEAHPVARPPSGSPPPEGGQAKPIPQSGQGTTPKVSLKPGKQLGQDDAVAGPSATGRRPRQTKGKEGKTSKVTVRFV